MGSAASVVLKCEICGVELPTIFDRKKCRSCLKMVCSNCLDYSEGNAHILGKRNCKKCFKLHSGNFTREDLNSYSVKELRSFLLGKDVSIQGCRERNDLSELMLHYSNVETPGDHSSPEHSRHIELLRERLRNETSESINDVPINHLMHVSGHNQLQSQSLVNNRRSSEEIPKVIDRSYKSLNDIKEESELAELSVHQLKEILVKNYVDFKGCHEKSELRDRVTCLWKQLKETREVVDADTVSMKDLCKICMDATMDCLLLECGHMVTCTACGKRLAECPVCRCFVSRIVHVFRS